MSASGDLPSIGALTVEEKCPDRSGETLVKCLQTVLIDSPDEWYAHMWRGQTPPDESLDVTSTQLTQTGQAGVCPA